MLDRGPREQHPDGGVAADPGDAAADPDVGEVDDEVDPLRRRAQPRCGGTGDRRDVLGELAHEPLAQRARRDLAAPPLRGLDDLERRAREVRRQHAVADRPALEAVQLDRDLLVDRSSRSSNSWARARSSARTGWWKKR